MNRRELIASFGGVGILPLAGCASLFSGRTLSHPIENRESDSQTHLNFKLNGERLTTVSILTSDKRFPASTGEEVPVDISVWHREGTKITSLTLKLQAPSDGAGVPAQVALITPEGTPRPPIQLYIDRSGASVFEIDEVGAQGDGTMRFEFLLTRLEETASELLVESTVGLTEHSVIGQNYTAKGHTLLPLPDNDI